MRFVLIVLVLMGLSFGGGFWWEYTRTNGVRGRLQAADAQLTTDQYKISLCQLQQQLLTLVDDTAAKNYGDAATVSTKFFNDLNAVEPKATEPQTKSVMQSISSQRDEVTADLAKADPASHDLVVQMSSTFHQALQTAAFQPTMSTP
jgi:hypothetical protein